MAVDVKQAYRTVLEDAFGQGRIEAFDVTGPSLPVGRDTGIMVP